MLSGEGNVNVEKTTIGIISKKSNFAHAAHFFVHFFAVVFARLQPETPRNLLVARFMEEMSYVFSFTLFSLPLIFTLHWWPLAFLIVSPPLQNFHVVLPAEKSLLCFLSLALDLCRPFCRWVSLACRLLSLFLCVFLALYSKFVDMTVTLSLILQKTRIQRQFPLSIFVFIDSLVVSALQEVGGYAISRQSNLGLHLSCCTCWLSYFILVCLWWGRAVGRSVGHMITKCSRMGSLPHFLTYSAPLRAPRARELRYKWLLFIICLSTSVGHLHPVLNHSNGALLMDLVGAWQDLTTAERILCRVHKVDLLQRKHA